jgi:hypothetical protein
MHDIFRHRRQALFSSMRRRVGALGAALVCLLAFAVSAQATIFVADAGASTDNTCTLAQAITLANYAASGILPADIGSQTTSIGTCTGATGGGNLILIGVPRIVLTGIDNYWYGPNALPPIASPIEIVGGFTDASLVTTIVAQHVGDPTPTTANAFRLFYVSGGMELPPGTLSISSAVLQGGYAKGGDSFRGGGGAGMGGAIFNQGTLYLQYVSLIGNTAQGGAHCGVCGTSAGGGMGQDGGFSNGGGFGGTLGLAYGGGSGGTEVGVNDGGGGGGGFVSGSNGGTTASVYGAPGGGNGGLGGGGGGGGSGGGGIGGDGGGGGGGLSPGDGTAGGAFGSGGGSGNFIHFNGGGGGGGVGGGGSRGAQSGSGGGGGGGGFGGGGGDTSANGGGSGGGGGFGGGAGFASSSTSGFGGGYAAAESTGGAGMGGAIFNHAGAVNLLNVTATGNSANGGSNYTSCNSGCNASGLGAALFNLNGSVTIDFSTLAGNFLSGNNARADNSGPEDGTIYSLAYGNKIQDGSASSATLTIHNSIIHGTQADGGLHSDVSVNVVNGAHTNASSLVYAGKNFTGQTYVVSGATQSGISPSTTDPLLGSLSPYFGTPVLPIGSISQAYDAAPSCLEADGATMLGYDERNTARPQFSQCDVGAYEFDGDYIFANGVDAKL